MVKVNSILNLIGNTPLAGFVPSILNMEVLDGIVTVAEEAFDYTQRLAKEEGSIDGISTGAALKAVAQKLPRCPRGSRVLTYNYDTVSDTSQLMDYSKLIL